MANIDFKNIDKGYSSDEKDVVELIQELDELVPRFVESDTFKREIFEGSDEDHYTEVFIKYAENQNPNSRFSYKQQASLPKRRSIDIGIHLKANSEHYLYNIEAKFLPSQDYVSKSYKPYAAIKRFRKCEHGLSHRNPEKCKVLTQSAILAYSKKKSFEDHLAKINKGIEKLARTKKADKFDLVWNESEQLEVIHLSDYAKLKSEHPRLDHPNIKLLHFWVDVSNNPSTNE